MRAQVRYGAADYNQRRCDYAGAHQMGNHVFQFLFIQFLLKQVAITWH